MRTQPRALLALLFLLSTGFIAAAPAAAAELPGETIYLSVNGKDSKSGTFKKPKRTFAAANAICPAGGQIVFLDSGDFGPIVLDKGVTLRAAPGMRVSLPHVAGGTAITINVQGADVTLLDLDLIGKTGVTGVQVVDARFVRLERCTFAGFSGHAVVYSTASNWSGGPSVTALDCAFRDNARGLYIDGGGSFYLRVQLERCSLVGNQVGVWLGGGSFNRMVMRECLVAGNRTAGLYSEAESGKSSLSLVTDCVFSGNKVAIHSIGSGGPSYVKCARCSIQGNDTGLLSESGGHIYSRGDNSMLDNATNGSFTGSFNAD